ncbi:MAG: universal stress protein [Leifsonia sp.]|uniref:universal stress protein n=1 Tax=Leifsonia sp. TaxID=1870902 RepID=UPI003F7F82BE
MSAGGEGPVIAGVHPGQACAVVVEAARLAAAIGRPLLCAHVGEDSYLTEWDRPGAREVASLHPGAAADLAAGAAPGDDSAEQAAQEELAASIARALDGEQTGWTLRPLGGDPAKALARLADEVDARLIVVGTRQKGFAPALEEFLAGSVAAKLAHEQDRPVVVVPVSHAAAERLAPRQ